MGSLKSRLHSGPTAYEQTPASVTWFDSDIFQELADILLKPAAENEYKTIKNAIMERFTDSANQHLHKLLTKS